MKVGLQKIINTFTTRNSFLLIVIVCVSYFNIFIIQAGPDIIFAQFAIIGLLFVKNKKGGFIYDWTPFVSLFLLFEFFRSNADNLSPFFSSNLYFIYHLEKALFKILPTIFFQKIIFLVSPTAIFIFLFFYITFFYYPAITAFILWIKNKALFFEFTKKLLILAYIGLFFYFVIPTAPPWYVAQIKNAPITRSFYESAVKPHSLTSVSLINHVLKGNRFAAFPSLHVMWPTFTTLFLIKKYKRRRLLFLLTIPIMISLSVIVSGEHYVLDVLAALIFSWIFV